MARMSEIAGGLQILLRYGNAPVGAEHDIIYASDVTVTPEDRRRLESLGWFWSEEFDCWAHFV